MPMEPFQTFRSILERSDHGPQVCGLLLMSWLAGCDERISDEETEILRQLGEIVGPELLPTLLGLARHPDPPVLRLAIACLVDAPRSVREAVLQLATGVAVAD